MNLLTRIKKKKIKIFIIGFNRTGTRTLHYFFKSNGLPSIHWDNNYLVEHFEKNLEIQKPLIGKQKVFNTNVNSNCNYDEAIVYSDITHHNLNKDAKDYYKILDKQYNNSKFILNIRDEKDWIRSRLNHCNVAEEQSIFHNCSKDELKNIWSEIYRAHLRDCEIYFKDRKDDFLKFNIDIDGPNELCEFLKASYPNLDKNKWKFIK